MTSDETSFINRYRRLGLSGVPMDSSSINRLEEHLGLPIPAAYRAYLNIAGAEPPPKLVGSDCHDHYLFNLHEWANELLKESGDPFRLPDDAIVFLMHQGYQFFYFRADGVNDDPAVYYYFEDRPACENPYDRFSDWVAAIV
ncbi:MAG: SMI1/KNR4 family protein [Pirellulales bacterium]|nr:SMI1/KNR4 family protein [Pirellulales bacterium]